MLYTLIRFILPYIYTGGRGDSTVISYLSDALRNAGTNDIVQHGACLGTVYYYITYCILFLYTVYFTSTTYSKYAMLQFLDL